MNNVVSTVTEVAGAALDNGSPRKQVGAIAGVAGAVFGGLIGIFIGLLAYDKWNQGGEESSDEKWQLSERSVLESSQYDLRNIMYM